MMQQRRSRGADLGVSRRDVSRFVPKRNGTKRDETRRGGQLRPKLPALVRTADDASPPPEAAPEGSVPLPPAAGAAKRRRPDRGAAAALAAVTAAALTGLALRIWVISSNLGPVDSDEAVGGLIALHLLDGEFFVFLWGNAYGGTLEAVLTAPLFAVFGTSTAALKAIPVLMYAAACLFTWRIGLRTVGPDAAGLGAVLLWVAPAALVLLSTKARMYYGATLVLACAAVLLGLRLAGARSRRDMALLGLVAGLGLWASPFFFYVFVPLALWLAAARPRRLLDLPWAVPGVLVGGAPWLAFNLRNGWPSLHEKPIPVETSYTERLGDFFTELLPRLLGLRTYSGGWVLGGAGWWLYVALLAGAAGLALWCATRPAGRRSPLAPFVVVLAGYPFLFAVPTASYYVVEPRYGMFLAPLVALLLAAALTRMTRRPSLRLGAVAVAAGASAAGLAALMEFARDEPGHHDLGPPETAPLAAELRGRGIEAAAADYWIAYATTFEAEERVTLTPTGTVRYRPYQERFERTGAGAYVFFPESAEEQAFRRRLAEQLVSHRREVLLDGDYVLYLLDQPLR